MQSAPRETLAIVAAAVAVTPMAEPVRRLIETLLDVCREDESVIAALKAANAELQDVVQLSAETEALLRKQLQQATH